MDTKELRQHLGRYSDTTCPDYLYLVYRILILGEERSNRLKIIDQALRDLEEAAKLRPLKGFNRGRRRMDSLEKRKYNW